MGNAGYYLRWLLAGAFPWSLLVPFGCLHWLRSSRLGAPEHLVALVYPLGLLLFYIAIDRKMSWYINPLYPFFAVIVGVGLYELGTRRPSTWVLSSVAAIVVLAFLLEVHPSDLQFQTVRARGVRLLVGWRAGTGPLLAGALATLLTDALVLARRFAASRLAPILAAGLATIVVSLGGARVAGGLLNLDYRSPLAELRLEIDRKLLAGEPLGFPLTLPAARKTFMERYYFGEEFEVEGEKGSRRNRKPPRLMGFKRTKGSSETEERPDRPWMNHPGLVR